MSEPKTFAIGDLVVLKSWSPDMTIERLRDQDGESFADVVWFSNREMPASRESFLVAALKASTNKALLAGLPT